MGFFHLGQTFTFFLTIWISIILSENVVVDVYERSTIDLNCTLDKIVPKCFWTKSNSELRVGDRYQYKNGNGANTQDCTLRITNASITFDSAVWKCGTENWQFSEEFNLTVYQIVSFVQEPKNVTVSVKENTKLDCVLNQVIPECHWERNRTYVTIGWGRYQYLIGDGKNTSVCSFMINNARAIDDATWQCAIYEKNKALRILSQEAKITIIPVSFLLEPDNLNLTVGNSGNLNCLLNVPVDKCQWKHNGIDVLIDGRYKFLLGNGSNTTYCSLVINDVRIIDNGTWQCVVLDKNVLSKCSREAVINVKPDKIYLVSDVYDFGNQLMTKTGSLAIGSLLTMFIGCVIFVIFNWLTNFDDYGYTVANIEKASKTTFLWDITKHKMETLADDEGSFEVISMSGPSAVKTKLKKSEKIKDPAHISLTIRGKDSLININFKITIGKFESLKEYTSDYEIAYILKNVTIGKSHVLWRKEPGYGKKRQEQWKKQWTEGWTEEINNITKMEMETFKSVYGKGKFQLKVCIRELAPLLEDAASYNGVLDWIIKNYSLKKKLQDREMNRPVISKAFYTSERGYRMRARLYLNSYRGSSSGTQIELSIGACIGRYDADLPRSFDHVIRITLIPWDSRFKPVVMITKICPSETDDEDEAELVMGESKIAFKKLRDEVESNFIHNDKLHLKIEIIPFATYISDNENQLLVDENFTELSTVKSRHVIK